MSNLFKRPDPQTATVEDVNRAIDDITKWDLQTGFSFAHIVIDDNNLDDGDILYCLRPAWIAEVMNQRLRDDFGKVTDLDNPKNLLNPIFVKQIEHMAEVIDLLNWLLAVPIEVRESVE